MTNDPHAIHRLQIEVDHLTRQLNHARQGLDVCASIMHDIKHDGLSGAGKYPGRIRRIARAVTKAIDLIDNDLPF